MPTWDVVVVGGGNAALCAALAARDEGARVLVIERSGREMRGGNTRHVRNLRDAHLQGDRFVNGSYGPEEFLDDIEAVTGGEGDAELTELLVNASLDIADWASAHGARWQLPLRGTLGLARTNRFFLGGGKALLNAYNRTAERLGVDVVYDTTVADLLFDGNRCTGVATRTRADDSIVPAGAVVVAAGGFEANHAWMRRFWGAAADNFTIRGSPLNDGLVLEALFAHGARPVADPTRFHAIAVDARAPRYDAGILSRLDAIPYGIVINRAGQRFYDEGEEMWPKRYAIWGRLLAEQPEQLGYVLLDSTMMDAFIPPMFPPVSGRTISELAEALGLDPPTVSETVSTFNRHVVDGTFDPNALDDCRTIDLVPPKSHWARRLDVPPFYAFPLRPGVTFTYHGVRVDLASRVIGEQGPFENLFAAGEIMAGNILTRGYLAGIGMTIGSVFGRLAGRQAAFRRPVPKVVRSTDVAA